MTFGLRVTAVAGLAIAVVGSSFGQSSSDYRGLITNGGEFKLLFNAQPVLNLRFGLFYDNWREFYASPNGLQPDGSFKESGTLNPGTMEVYARYSSSGGTGQLVISATPNRTITANSYHLNIRFDPYYWAEGTVTDGAWTGTFPRRLDQGLYNSSNATNFVARSKGGLTLTFGGSAVSHYSIRDSRQYNVGFELRAWEGSSSWSAGVTKTFTVNITPNMAMPLGPDAPVSISQNADWIPLDHKLNVTAGSALDWSKPNPVYAGSKGWLKASSSGKFVFENDPLVPVKFYGTNLQGFACFPTHAEADAMAADLAMRGYNAVRMHNFDQTVLEPSASNSTTISAYWLERMMYLIEALKKKGIYVCLNLYGVRSTKQDEVMAGAPLTWPEYKASLLCIDSVRQNLLTWTRNLLDTSNPYSGLKLKDDPGIAWIALVNENDPMWTPSSILRPAIVTALNNAVGGTWNVSTDAGARAADALLSQEYEYLKAQVRNMGVKSLLTMANGGEQCVLSRTRSRLDFTDAHHYYANPAFTGGVWGQIPATMDATTPLSLIRDLGRTSIQNVFGKPHMVSEFDAVVPNPYRGEFGLTFGALAAVQRWDAAFRYSWTDRASSTYTMGPAQMFKSISDPATLAAERAFTALFMRGDIVSSAPQTVVYVPFDTAGLNELKDIPLIKNGALQVPVAVSNSIGVTNPATPILDGLSTNLESTVKADLFQQTLRIATANTCGVVATPGATLTAGNMTVNLQKARASLWVSTVDGLPLESSHRMLMAHVTEIQNTGTTWSGVERKTVTNLGTLPHLAKVGTATVTLTGINASTARIYRLDMSGKRVATVAFSKASGGITFNLSTQNPLDGKATLFYEIIQ